ncbi:GAF domain-containing protein [Nocardioides marmoribigeumensis]|uniref:Signal transduction histidine kinase n=1 Tax=Nocardioides marmoribigeumensis TaxID=433649 RepID=A0ABU2BPT1_9ACTN|nr:GAF domain-containing protein [Nocardioides marmoribigeumensis]MDR7360639.1 signal transduction histidine kinase [Nocardioides marmoribigeumensis]
MTSPDSPDDSRAARALLDAVVAISTDLDLHRVLSRIVESACELTGATYGALGVVDRTGGLQNFVIHGMDPEARDRIGDLPHGRGILGVVIDDPRPLRLDDLTQHPQSYGFPPGHPPMTTFLGVPIEVHGTVFGNLYLTEKHGGFTDEDVQTVTALAGAAGHVIGNARTYGLSERRRQWLEATGRVGDALQPPIPVDDAFAEVVRILRSVTTARAVAVVHLDEDGAVVEASDGPEAAALQDLLDREGDALLDPSDPRDLQPVVLDGRPRFAVVLPMRSALSASNALLAVFDDDERLQDAQEQQLMHSFADHVGLALDRTRAVQDREQLAILSDRDRIARDLHDLVIQRLFATGMRLQGLRMLADRPEFAAGLDRAVDDIDLTVKDIRGTIFELQSRKEASLRRDVRKLVKEYVEALGFAPAVRTAGPVDTAVPDQVQVELLAVLREALSNIARHARATLAEVQLDVTSRDVVLQVVDDGVGLPSEVHESGLRNARTRASALGGRFTLGPHAPRGTALRWQVPLRQ